MKRQVQELHNEILEIINERSDGQKDGNRYEGYGHLKYKISKPEERKIAKEFLKDHPELSREKFFFLLDSLYRGLSSNEKYVASLLLENNKEFRKEIDLERIDGWLKELEGWAEIDCLCQSNFSANEVLSRWSEWEEFVRSLNKSENISKRRASLVLLIKTTRGSDDERPVDLMLEMIDNVKDEKDKLITKAVSWALREMVKKHADRVRKYLDKNEDLLPAVAVRETRNKLRTGKK